MAAAEVALRPAVDYSPRAQFEAFHNRAQRWAVIVAHRRAGKTVACVMELLTRALATSKADGRFAYIAPFREQAKTVAWQYLKRYSINVVKDPDKDLRESDLSVRLLNGSEVRLFGSDNPNALRGMYLDGVVLDEYADMKPTLWGEVIRPTLSDRKGWAVFIGTPKGRNAFYRLIYGDNDIPGAINDPQWYTLFLKASQTGIMSPGEIADLRKTMTADEYEQEMECSFDAAIKGAVYASEIKVAQERITSIPYDAAKLVHTVWDIGFGDSTAIWFFQVVGKEIRIIDFYEANGEAAPYYASILRGKSYNYDTAYLPHDADNGQSATGHSFNEVMQSNGFKTEIVPKLGLEEGINAARMMFSRCYFDAKRCERGLEALKNYRWDYNAQMGELKPRPVHNWASHASDAFRYLATIVDQIAPPMNQDPYAAFKSYG